MNNVTSPFTNEAFWRFGIFAALLLVFMLAEALWPRRKKVLTRAQRWPANFGLSLISTLALRLMGPLSAYGAAFWAAGNDIGLLNRIDLPPVLEFLAALILLDLAIYIQHWLSHKVPFFWRFHRVHHSDRDIDTTSALRFHPVEIILSMLYKTALVLILGPAAAAVIIFEIFLNAASMFNHANLALPLWLDKALRLFLVTPDMHRVHHSVYAREQMHNFGFNLPVWDRLFGTYQGAPQDGQIGMTIGLSDEQTEAPAKLSWLMAFPFR